MYTDDPDEVTIFDEVDFLLIDKGVKLCAEDRFNHSEKKRRSRVVGLSATASGELEHIERTYLCDVAKFDIVDSRIATTESVEPREVMVADYLGNREIDIYARLMFVPESRFEEIESLARLNNIVVAGKNVTDLAVLRQLKAGSIYLVSEQINMRGLDYRCATGIALLIAAPFDSKRALRQAYGRVSRYQERCLRFVDATLGRLNLIDRKLESYIVANIVKASRDFARQTKQCRVRSPHQPY